jgi:hypothetical protein
MKLNLKLGLMAAAVALPLTFAAKDAHALAVGVELALLVDVSGSVDGSEYSLQKNGYINAFNNPALITAIQNSAGGSIAVTYIEWSSSSQQIQSVDWMLVNDAASGAAFASAIGATTRPFSGGTNPDSAINFAVPLFSGNGFEGTRLVIDVSGDGSGSISSTQAARDAALAAGIDTINGIVIGGSTGVEDFYNDSIKAGDGAFVIAVDSFDDFNDAILQKLTREITQDPDPIPEPTTMLTFAVGAVAAGWLSRRRRRTA